LEPDETIPKRPKRLVDYDTFNHGTDATLAAVLELICRSDPRREILLSVLQLRSDGSRQQNSETPEKSSWCFQRRPAVVLNAATAVPAIAEFGERPPPNAATAAAFIAARPSRRAAASPRSNCAPAAVSPCGRLAAQPLRAELGIHSRRAVATRLSRRADASTCSSLAASPHGRFAARMSRRDVSPSCRAAAARQSPRELPRGRRAAVSL
jgi:hypothetical protein